MPTIIKEAQDSTLADLPLKNHFKAFKFFILSLLFRIVAITGKKRNVWPTNSKKPCLK